VYSCDLTLPALGADPEAVEAAHELAACLARNGQLVGPFVVGRKGVDLRISGLAPLLDALDRSSHSSPGLKALDGLAERGAGGPEQRVDPEPLTGTPFHFAEAADASLLVLRTAYNSLVSPLWDPESDLHLPLYRVPIEEPERERLYFWMLDYQRFAGLEFSGHHEALINRELGDPDGSMIRLAREHAARIEEATEVPVYTWLVRNYGAPEGDGERPCPSCGEPWRVPGESDQELQFRCDRCRLASHLAFCTDPEDWRRLGGRYCGWA